jgi:glutathione S-transferase
MTEPIRIVGAEGSPYSRKLRAVLRFRRIPYRWIHQGSPEARDLPRPRVELLPQLILAGDGGEGEWVARTDTTPLIRELEARHTDRSVIPSDPALAFLDALIEDFADEWVTKHMFHYRWAYPPDVANASSLLPAWFKPDQPDASIRAFGEQFGARQVERLWVVGSNETTRPVLEQSYERLLALLDAHLTESRFVLGNRPASCDFGLFGQLTQLTRVDPTPAAIAQAKAIRVVAWVDLCEDLSGRETADSDWIDASNVSATLRALFEEIGRTYAPFMLANAQALTDGADEVECTIDGRRWSQRPFPYQGKCLQWLRSDYAALGAEARQTVEAALAGTGCEALFAD